MDRRHFLALAAATAATSHSALSAVAGEPVLEVRARVGPWPVISRLIAYKGRVWFASSVKWRNHNSADIWSLDPVQGDVRYERHLFSQDAGIPLVHHGLLYWPFEDNRFSIGWGMIEVTDGLNWQPLVVPTAEIFHTNALVSRNDQIVAITSAWRAGLQMSGDLGRSWTQLYDHPTPKGRLSRLRDPVVLHDELYGQLEQPGGINLVKFVENRPVSVPGWPQNRRISALTRHQSRIVAAVRAGKGYHIWSTDGHTSRQVSKQPVPVNLTEIASDGNRLWAISTEKNGGRLWSSPQGIDWTGYTRFSGGQPLSLDIIAGKIYVAGAGDDGRGIIWGPSEHKIPRTISPAVLPRQFPVSRGNSQGKIDWQAAGARLDAVLGDIKRYQNHGRKQLRGLVFDAVRFAAPPDFFAQRLKAQFPPGTIPAFGGQLDVKAIDMGQSYIFWGMGLAQQKNIPVSFLKRLWRAPANSFEKYFDPQSAAIWAAMVSGQKDTATIDSLIARLAGNLDPLWLRGQIIGTLGTLTGKEFAYDEDKWHQWWTTARTTWD